MEKGKWDLQLTLFFVSSRISNYCILIVRDIYLIHISELSCGKEQTFLMYKFEYIESIGIHANGF